MASNNLIELQKWQFRIINNIPVDLTEFQFQFFLSDISLDCKIQEQFATGNLYINFNSGEYIFPFRYNTNILPTIYIGYQLIYDFNSQYIYFYKE